MANDTWPNWWVWKRISRKKRPHVKKEKVLFQQDNVPCVKAMKIVAKPQCFRTHRTCRFGLNEEVITETNEYFEAKDK